MHLAERGRRCRLLAEALELRAPIRAKLGGHAAAHERPAHGRRLVLELRQLVGVFGRDRVGDGREQLRDLHERSLEAAQRRGELRRLLLVVLAAEQVAGAHPRRHAAGSAADARIALHAAREAVALAVARIELVILPGTISQNVHSAQISHCRNASGYASRNKSFGTGYGSGAWTGVPGRGWTIPAQSTGPAYLQCKSRSGRGLAQRSSKKRRGKSLGQWAKSRRQRPSCLSMPKKASRRLRQTR